MRKITNKEFALVLYELIKDCDNEKKLEKLLYNYLLFLQKRQAFKNIKDIIKIFIDIYNSKNNIIDVEVETAHKFDKDDKEFLVQMLKKVFNNKNLNINYVLNRNLIGGIRVKTNNLLIDASIERQLNKLVDLIA